jgi:hypothetical protein
MSSMKINIIGKNFRMLERTLHLKKFVIVCLFLILFTPYLGSSFEADAQTRDCTSKLVTRVDADYNGPVFLDAYFTDNTDTSGTSLNPIQLEVGPGEGPSSLAVVLSNRGSLDLYAIVGYLSLPDGFEASGISDSKEAKNLFATMKGRGIGSSATAAPYMGQVIEGEVFTLYFDVNITDEALVSGHAGQMIVDYSTPEHVRSCKSALLTIPFILPGKVVLDIGLENQYLTPKVDNPVNIILSNKGSSDATGVVATIVSVGDSGQSRGSSDSSSISLQSSDTSIVNLGSNTFNIGTIPAGESVEISTVLFPDDEAAATVQNLDLQIEYGNSYGYKQTAILTTGLVIEPNPLESSLIISHSSKQSPPLITGGIVEDFEFKITNNGDLPLTDLIVTIAGESESLKIVGDSKWAVDELESGQTRNIETDVFADTTLIDSPTSITITTDYISLGEYKTDTTNLGLYVSGDIDLSLYDLAVNKIGNSLYLVGNVLNEGSTTGKFATIELTSMPKPSPEKTPNSDTLDSPQEQSPSGSGTFGSGPPGEGLSVDSSQGFSQKGAANNGPQYLGDLTEDSTIPFSMPLPFSSLEPGTYPFTFKLTYADDLRNTHEIVFEKEVPVSQSSQQFGNNQFQGNNSSSGIPTEAYLIIGLAVIVIIVIVVIRKRKSNALQSALINNNSANDDIESLIDMSNKKTKSNDGK